MENEAVRRRMNMIVSHFAAKEEVSSAAHLFPLNCSRNFNTVIQRRDNQMNFARQGTTYQACFMRPISIKENFGQSNSFQSQRTQCTCGDVSGAKEYSSRDDSGAPLFSRPTQMKPEQNTLCHSTVLQECQLSMAEPPKFARPFHGQRKIAARNIRHEGVKWSPRMDVAESGCYYVLTIELPGVNINSTRVEVDERNLIVTGKRTMQWWRGANGSDYLKPTYQSKEILQGLYEVVWPIPSNVNKNNISAEFVDGFLHITLPKMREPNFCFQIRVRRFCYVYIHQYKLSFILGSFVVFCCRGEGGGFLDICIPEQEKAIKEFSRLSE